MLKLIFFFIIADEVVAGLWTFYRFALLNCKLDKVKNIKHRNESNAQMLVVIPCLREQDIITETVDYFLEICKGFNANIVVVTTQKEVAESSMELIPQFVEDILKNKDITSMISKYNKLLPISCIKRILDLSAGKTYEEVSTIVSNMVNTCLTTYQVVENLISSNDKYKAVHVINYPNVHGIMADQLNYLLDNLDMLGIEGLDTSTTYFSLYNADSRPSGDTFREVICAISENKYPEILQQYSACVSNWDELSDVMRGFGIYQSNFELRSGLINSAFPSRFLLSRVVGHGLFARLDTLLNMDGFQTDFWCEDMYMGGYLANQKTPIVPLYTIENMETPISLTSLIHQNAVWFTTSSQYTKILKHVVNRQKKLTINGIGWYLQMMRGAIAWLCIPLFVAYTIGYSVFSQNVIAFITSLAAYTAFIILTHLPTIQLVERMLGVKLGNKIKVLLFTAVAVFISNAGPVYCLLGMQKEKYKTVR